MTMTNDNTRYERGLKKLVEVDGHEGQEVVSRLGDLGRYIVEFAYGDIYSRTGMSLREKEIVTVSVLAALGGREPQLHIHMQAALRAGITPEEIEEIILQTIPYAGFPTAINAMNVLSQVKKEVQTEK